MKAIKIFSLGALALLGFAALTSCGDEEFEGEVLGVAMMTAEQDGQTHRVRVVRPGDEVMLQILGTSDKVSSLNIVTISGITYYPEVHYLVDGKEVGMTSDYNSYFGFRYVVPQLEPGEHELSVDIPQIYKNINYVIDVAPSVFTVAESVDAN